MKKSNIVIFLVVILVIIGVFGYAIWNANNSISGDNIYMPNTNNINQLVENNIVQNEIEQNTIQQNTIDTNTNVSTTNYIGEWYINEEAYLNSERIDEIMEMREENKISIEEFESQMKAESNTNIVELDVDSYFENKIKFEDYALLTGSVFFTKYCLASKYAYFIHKFMMRGDPLKRASIYADEAKLVLRAFVWLLQTARDYELTELAGRITGLLNSENYIRLITDSTYGFYIDKSSVNNPKEDFHTEVLSLLAKANELADLHGEDKAILRTFAMFIAKRHSFLEKI